MCSGGGLSENFFFFLHFYGLIRKALFQQAAGAQTLSGHCLDHRPEILKFSTFMIASAHIHMNTCNCAATFP